MNGEIMQKKKVVVGMSGGVDSSVAAYLLLEQGYEVIGVTMQIWQDETNEDIQDNGGCCGLSAVDDARRVANSLAIPYYVMNFKKEFAKQVIDYFVDEYFAGRTPNPCIACNRYVKWESLLDRSLKLGADFIATGHYARIIQLENGRFALKCSATDKKDQTYALYNLTQEQLKRTLMPVGEYTKEEIREIASKINLRVANKKDSQEICFVEDNDYGRFIQEYTGKSFEPGNFVDLNGKIIGKHKGIIHYTVGQRKGLNLALGKPAFVIAIHPEENEVVIGDNSDVFANEVIANRVNWMSIEHLNSSVRCSGKIRYNQQAAPCEVSLIDQDTIKVVFDEPQRAITPGQALVLYDGSIVMGGGTIIR